MTTINFKIVFKDECHRFRSAATSCKELYELIAKKYKDLAPQNFYVEHLDLDGDLVRITTEDDYE